MLWIILVIIISYLIGSIPTAYILGMLFKGKDLRQLGSRNVGATNAFRVLGKKIGISVLLIDITKGIIPVVILSDFITARNLAISPELIRIITGLAAFCGHNWTVFLNFKGGKGVAVSCGVLIGLAIKYSILRSIFAYVLAIWLIIFLLFRMVSLASIISSISLPALMLLFRQNREFLLMSFILSTFIILRHRSNFKRIITGHEPKVRFKRKDI